MFDSLSFAFYTVHMTAYRKMNESFELNLFSDVHCLSNHPQIKYLYIIFSFVRKTLYLTLMFWSVCFSSIDVFVNDRTSLDSSARLCENECYGSRVHLMKYVIMFWAVACNICKRELQQFWVGWVSEREPRAKCMHSWESRVAAFRAPDIY